MKSQGVDTSVVPETTSHGAAGALAMSWEIHFIWLLFFLRNPEDMESGYTYMAVWVGGLEVWEIRVMCKIDLKNVFLF